MVKSYRVIKSMNASYLSALGYHDFKIGHIMVMMNLTDAGITTVELAKKANISKQAMSKLVLELHEKKFLRTETHPMDKRASLVKASDSGLIFLNDLQACRQHVEAEIGQIIGTEKVAELQAILFTLVNHVEKNPNEAYLNSDVLQAKL